MNKKIIAVAVCLLVLLSVIGILQLRSNGQDERMAEEITTSAEAPTMVISATEDETTDTITVQSSTPTQAYIEDGSFVIGAKDAPITIMEFSSLSCPHCAAFHKSTLKDIKKDYVDTGKVKFVFNDFPLNQSAVAGSLLLKCVKLENRYDFMDMLFEQQSQWAFDANFITKLKQYAALVGVSNDEAEKCIRDTKAEEAMFAKMREASETYKIDSTPSFIIQPGNEMLSGALPYGTFSTKIEALLNTEK